MSTAASTNVARPGRPKNHATTPISRIAVSAYKVPTDAPESDGTYSWNATTLVLVEATAGGKIGVGYSYADTATATLIRDLLASVVIGTEALAIPAAWSNMVESIRNLGRPGIASMAISAVDSALWDLKAKLLDLSLINLLGALRDAAPIYGSGGFTSYSIEKLQEQLGGWVAEGIPRVKMKIGRDPYHDAQRVRAAREAIGPDAELFVDANGAYGRKQALAMAETFAEESRVSWFEEPVSSDDLEGLRLLRDRGPAGLDIAAGEYGYDLPYFRRMLEAGSVDVLQADATRCAGITGFLRVGALCESRGLALSAHCAPSLHAQPSCALPAFRHLEYFYDHSRIEKLFFDGALTPIDGKLRPDPNRPGFGLEFKRQDAARFAV
jgi:L-alanine-DL-glutamate epimerase-like enolase superfamily enzyme